MPMFSPIRINGLSLPSDLCFLLREGKWKGAYDLESVKSAFPGHEPDFSLYDPSYMLFENRYWSSETSLSFLGVADPSRPPGNLDPGTSILIGTLGTGTDQPIALDYRHHDANPPVVTLDWSNYSQRGNRWRVVAADVRGFAELLGIFASWPPDTPNKDIDLIPRITNAAWGRLCINDVVSGRDMMLTPSGPVAWDWARCGTNHSGGIQLAAVHFLLQHGARSLILSTGYNGRLNVSPAVRFFLGKNAIEHHILDTESAVSLYNLEATKGSIGALIHSTC